MNIEQKSAKTVSDRAMAAVASGDRAAWLGCFGPDAVLQDPVGGSPLDPEGSGLRGRAAFEKFWDIAIATMAAIRFDVHREFPSGQSIAKVATVHLDLPTKQTVSYEGVFVYDVDESGRIQALRGYFTPPFG